MAVDDFDRHRRGKWDREDKPVKRNRNHPDWVRRMRRLAQDGTSETISQD